MRPAVLTLLLLCLSLTLRPASAQAQTWAVVKVERTSQGFVTEKSPMGTEKKLLVFGKKNEYLNITVSYQAAKNAPTAGQFKVRDEKGDTVGKQTFYLRGATNVVVMSFQGDWTSLDGLALEGPGGKRHPLGKAKAPPKKK